MTGPTRGWRSAKASKAFFCNIYARGTGLDIQLVGTQVRSLVETNSKQMNKLSLKQFFAMLALFAVTTQMVSFSVFGQSKRFDNAEVVVDETQNDGSDEIGQSKIAPDLQEKTDELIYGSRSDKTEKVIIRYKSGSSLDDFSGIDISDTERTQKFAQEAESNREKAGILVTDLVSFRGRVKKSYANVGMASAETSSV